MYFLSGECAGCGLPAPLRERYRMADGPALKVALFLLGGGEGDAEKICDALSMPAETVERALTFWCKAGLLSDRAPAPRTVTDAAGSVLREVQPAAPPRHVRAAMTPERAAELSLRDPAIAVMLQETQRFLGRTLDAVESRTLLELYEYDELPVDLILMLVAYCLPRVRNKRALCTMVARIADDWYAQGIATPADAEKQIRLLERREQREVAVAAALELADPSFSKGQKLTIAKWFEEYGYNESIVREAYLVKGNASIAYIGKILQNWYNSGYRTLKQIRDAGSAHNAPAAPPAARKKGGGSLLKKAVRNGAKED